jgi:hypothetical protein
VVVPRYASVLIVMYVKLTNEEYVDMHFVRYLNGIVWAAATEFRT